MNKKFIGTMILLILVQTQLFSQSKTSELSAAEKEELETLRKEKERREYQDLKKESEVASGKEDENNKKKTYLFLQGGGGNTSTEFDKGNVAYGKVGAEFRVFPWLGIGSGFSNNNITIKDDPSVRIGSYFLFNLLVPPPITQTAGNITNLFSLLLLTTPTGYKISYNAIHFDVNFHFLKDSFFDPYVGFGIIAGLCTSASGAICTASGYELKLGAQLNFERVFLFGQGQLQSINFTEAGVHSNTMASFGAGIRF